jgi:hypothetical protein
VKQRVVVLQVETRQWDLCPGPARAIPVYGESYYSPDVPGLMQIAACPCLFLAQSQLREFLSTQ